MKKLAILLLVLLLVGCETKPQEPIETIKIHFTNDLLPFSPRFVEIPKGKAVGIQWFIPEIPGYTFVEWKTLEGNVVTQNTAFSINTWLIPVFNENMYTVTFISNSDYHIAPIQLTYAFVYLEQFIPEKDEYEFDGWYYDEALTNKVDIAVKLVEEITVYGKWVPKIYSLTYYISQKSQIVVNFQVGDQVIPYEPLYLQDFIGWVEADSDILFDFSSMPQRDVTVYMKTGTNE
jgi:uncharacterized repeat protein (TIGR02543 family)